VEDYGASLITAQLLFLEAENPKKEISMYINSPGGVVTPGSAIYDTMQYIRPAVQTLMRRPGGLGGVAAAVRRQEGHAVLPAQFPGSGPSALGVLLWPGRRYRPACPGNLKLKRRLNEIYAKHTGQSRSRRLKRRSIGILI
jgi:ATP-dependent Clp protease protease subunit